MMIRVRKRKAADLAWGQLILAHRQFRSNNSQQYLLGRSCSEICFPCVSNVISYIYLISRVNYVSIVFSHIQYMYMYIILCIMYMYILEGLKEEIETTHLKR